MTKTAGRVKGRVMPPIFAPPVMPALVSTRTNKIGWVAQEPMP